MDRLTSETNEDGLVLDEATSRDSVHPGKWHHVMFSYVETLENNEEEESKLVGKVWKVSVLKGLSRIFSQVTKVYSMLIIIASVYDRTFWIFLQNVYLWQSSPCRIFFPPAVHSLPSYTFFFSILIYQILTVLSTLFSKRIESKCDTEKKIILYCYKSLRYTTSYYFW